MERILLQKYARFLIQDCLKVKKGQPLLITGDKLNEDFAKILKEEGQKLEIGEIHILLKDSFAQRELFLHTSYEECLQSPLLDRHLYNDNALKGGALLSLASPIPHIHDGVDSHLLQKLAAEMERRISICRESQQKNNLPWCIAGVPNEYWAKEILPDAEDSLEELWRQILTICHIYEENPGKVWDDTFATLEKRCRILNDAHLTSLHYEASNGTNITFELPKEYVFASAKSGKYICNMPSLELFTTPKKDGVNGIVYNSKPLFYQGVKIDSFYIRFEHGRITDAKAEIHNDYFQKLIEMDEGSHYLGEVSFVDFDSKINQSGILFQNTLFDENACCHLAIGRGFPECFVDGEKKEKEELEKMGMNTSLVHVDFMIGTRDLKIVATKENGEEMLLMEHGKLVI